MKLSSHYDLSDQEFEKQFAECKLPPEIFNHEAHLRLAWIHLTNYGLEQSLIRIPRQLKEYVVFAGAADKYNHTLTLAAIYAVDHFRSKTAPASFPDFIKQFPELKNQFRELMQSHYSFDIFKSPEARHTFMQPDLAAFNRD